MPENAVGTVVAQPAVPPSSVARYAEGIEPSEGARLTASIRQSLNIEGRNVAIAESVIDGRRELLTAVSGKASPQGTVSSPAGRLFSTKSSGAMTRAFDTEVKILGSVASKLEANAHGTISIFTERPPCYSCTNVIEQFQQQFPGVKVIITSGEKAK